MQNNSDKLDGHIEGRGCATGVTDLLKIFYSSKICGFSPTIAFNVKVKMSVSGMTPVMKQEVYI